ncbi:hypothetical protein Krac_0838 [Ktedonobacter racemifer DSM 44963]|uniref:Uncharacterized protein n=1 Tax=Ktedonobacter racemifer DSM 44963 TaxID=485913 RepID=D6U5J6_KTERA|nr:hypothetical protein Krac_0838 [Ktedonobacter racemifer DSM 44963]
MPIFNLLRIYKNGVQRFTSGAAFQTVNGCAAQVEGQVLTLKGQTCSLGMAFTTALTRQ